LNVVVVGAALFWRQMQQAAAVLGDVNVTTRAAAFFSLLRSLRSLRMFLVWTVIFSQ
jgi:hypothetical protein